LEDLGGKLKDALGGLVKLPSALILRMQLVPAMDSTALAALERAREVLATGS